jgi:DNA (cytosine-5)-methyltransferase 1
MIETYRVVDLFAGCGGLSTGFLAARAGNGGFESVAAVEIDPDAAASYAANVGDHVFCGDISDWLKRADLPLDVDVILGGPPCQGFSALGKQEVRDERNAMWRRYVDAVVLLQPSFFVLENVREFLKSGQFTSLRNECRPKGRLPGYAIEAHVLDSSLYGSPQRRKRAIVVGRRRTHPELGAPPVSAQRSTVRNAFDGLPEVVTRKELPSGRTVTMGGIRPGPFHGLDIHVTRHFTEQSRSRYEAIPVGGNRFDLPPELLAPCWRNHHSGSGDVMGRMHWDQPSVTIRTEFFKPEKGRYLHPVANRPITHLEAGRLQGFPDDYLWFGSKVSIARQIGNAVPIPLGTALGTHVLDALVRRGTASAETVA